MRFSLISALSLVAIPLAHAAEFTVVVGGPNTLAFTPNNITAAVGDDIIFVFHEKNHTVTQSTLATPCVPLAGGFDSGFQPVAANATTFPQGKFTVQDLNPVWVFCRQANHCEQGMVFAVNPGDKMAQYISTATGSSATTTTGGTTTNSTTTTPGSTTGGSTTGPTDHKIIVGGDGIYAYNPPNITAAVGDTITFEFHQKNHTVTQSSFGAPCEKLQFTSSPEVVGFDSDFMPVADGATTFPTYTITVNNTTPIWVYCRQATHCGMGMVFAANADPTSAKSFSAFQQLAKQLNGTAGGGAPSSGYGSGASRSTVAGGAGIALGALLAVMALL